MPTKQKRKKYTCDCHLNRFQVCDLCQGISGKGGKDKKPYHIHGPNIYDPNCKSCRKYGMPRSTTVNTHLLEEDDPNYCSDEEEKKMMVEAEFGYHTVPIKRGTLGETSKIQEELDELRDAEKQNVKILIHCELADLYGALEARAIRYGLTMSDLHDMARLTQLAFEKGYR